MSYRTLRRVMSGLLAVTALAVCAVSGASAATGPAKPDVSAQFTTAGSVAPQFLQNATTIEHWTFQYTDPTNHVIYPITMVGKDPRDGGTSTIHTEIIALKMNFVAGHQDTSALTNLGFAGFTAPPLNHTFDGDRRVNSLLNSPIFTSNTYPAVTGGLTGQLSDTFMRSQFINAGGSNYHVNLVNDSVKHVTLDLLASNGLAYQRPVGAWRTANGMPTDTITGVADVGWFSSQLQSLMGSLQISATTVPIFLTDNVLLYRGQGNYLNCCILGYHGAGMPIGHGAGSANGNGSCRSREADRHQASASTLQATTGLGFRRDPWPQQQRRRQRCQRRRAPCTGSPSAPAGHSGTSAARPDPFRRSRSDGRCRRWP